MVHGVFCLLVHQIVLESHQTVFCKNRVEMKLILEQDCVLKKGLNVLRNFVFLGTISVVL